MPKSLFIGKVYGTSMQPVLMKGDSLLVRNINWKKVRIGDILLCKYDNHTYCHRLIRSKRDYLITKGDNVKYADPPISRQNVFGKVIGVQRGKEYVRFEGLKYFLSSSRRTINSILEYYRMRFKRIY